MAKRKFNEYLILVTFKNGNVEEIEYTSDFKRKADKTSYKEMLSVYSEIKEQYEDKNCTIDFLGINDEEKMIIFSKQNVVEDISESTTLRDDVVLLFEKIQQIREKAETLADKKVCYNTEVNEIYHKEIENANDLSDEHKLKTFDKLRNVLINRRDVSSDLDFYNKHKNVLNSIFGYTDKLTIESEKYVSREVEMLEKFKETGVLSTGSKRIVDYTSFKDRMAKMSQLQDKYTIVHDEENSRLICTEKNKSKQSKVTNEEKEVSRMVLSKGGTLKYKTFVQRDLYLELLDDKFNTVVDDSVKMKITCGNLKKGI